MKAGDKIVTDEGVELIAERTDIPCVGRYFDGRDGCMVVRNDEIKCWDDYGAIFIFKEIQP